MVQSFKDFMAGIFSLALGWKIWLFCLMSANFFIPLFFYRSPEAQFSMIAFMASGILGVILVKIQGFTRLLGLMHIFWVPLVIYMIGKINLYPASQSMGIWIRGLIIVNTISLIIDFVDVFRYIKGERKVIGDVVKN